VKSRRPWVDDETRRLCGGPRVVMTEVVCSKVETQNRWSCSPVEDAPSLGSIRASERCERGGKARRAGARKRGGVRRARYGGESGRGEWDRRNRSRVYLNDPVTRASGASARASARAEDTEREREPERERGERARQRERRGHIARARARTRASGARARWGESDSKSAEATERERAREQERVERER